jgi:predicted ATP-grasp superfamily ATP-dependent carboligase
MSAPKLKVKIVVEVNPSPSGFYEGLEREASFNRKFNRSRAAL